MLGHRQRRIMFSWLAQHFVLHPGVSIYILLGESSPPILNSPHPNVALGPLNLATSWLPRIHFSVTAPFFSCFVCKKRSTTHRWKEVEMQLFSSKPITGTATHHRIVNNYRQLPADYGSLPANYRHLYGFHYIGCISVSAVYRQGWPIYRRLPAVMKNYRHVGNMVMKSCTFRKRSKKKRYEISDWGALLLLGHGFCPPINSKNRHC